MLPRDRLHRMLLINGVSGMAIGFLFSVALLGLNTAQLGRLISADPDGLTAFLLLSGGFALMCGGVVAGAAVMSQSSYADE